MQTMLKRRAHSAHTHSDDLTDEQPPNFPINGTHYADQHGVRGSVRRSDEFQHERSDTRRNYDTDDAKVLKCPLRSIIGCSGKDENMSTLE